MPQVPPPPQPAYIIVPPTIVNSNSITCSCLDFQLKELKRGVVVGRLYCSDDGGQDDKEIFCENVYCCQFDMDVATFSHVK